jgi:hypothetical protein
MMSKIQCPRININGQDGAVLLRQYNEAYKAIIAARDAICAIDIHGRDYHTLDCEAYGRARDEHHGRIRALAGIKADLLAICISISLQIDNQKKG